MACFLLYVVILIVIVALLLGMSYTDTARPIEQTRNILQALCKCPPPSSPGALASGDGDMDRQLDNLAKKLGEKESSCKLKRIRLRQNIAESEVDIGSKTIQERYKTLIEQLKNEMTDNEQECQILQRQIELVAKRRAELKKDLLRGRRIYTNAVGDLAENLKQMQRSLKPDKEEPSKRKCDEYQRELQLAVVKPEDESKRGDKDDEFICKCAEEAIDEMKRFIESFHTPKAEITKPKADVSCICNVEEDDADMKKVKKTPKDETVCASNAKKSKKPKQDDSTCDCDPKNDKTAGANKGKKSRENQVCVVSNVQSSKTSESNKKRSKKPSKESDPSKNVDASKRNSGLPSECKKPLKSKKPSNNNVIPSCPDPTFCEAKKNRIPEADIKCNKCFKDIVLCECESNKTSKESGVKSKASKKSDKNLKDTCQIYECQSNMEPEEAITEEKKKCFILPRDPFDSLCDRNQLLDKGRLNCSEPPCKITDDPIERSESPNSTKRGTPCTPCTFSLMSDTQKQDSRSDYPCLSIDNQNDQSASPNSRSAVMDVADVEIDQWTCSPCDDDENVISIETEREDIATKIKVIKEPDECKQTSETQITKKSDAKISVPDDSCGTGKESDKVGTLVATGKEKPKKASKLSVLLKPFAGKKKSFVKDEPKPHELNDADANLKELNNDPKTCAELKALMNKKLNAIEAMKTPSRIEIQDSCCDVSSHVTCSAFKLKTKKSS